MKFELTTTSVASVWSVYKGKERKNAAVKKAQSTHDQIKNMVDFIEIKYTSLQLPHFLSE